MRALGLASCVLGIAMVVAPEDVRGDSGWTSSGDGLAVAERVERETLAEKLEAEAQVRRSSRRVAELERRVRAQGKALVRMSRSGAGVGTGLGNALDHVARIERLKRMTKRDLLALSAARHAQLDLETRIARISRDAEDAQARVKALRERRALLDEAFALPEGPSEPSDPWASAEDVEYAGEGLAPWRGHLILPVAGRVDVFSATRENVQGLEFRAPQGAVVRAIAPGRISFVGSDGASGEVVVLDHGRGFRSFYSGVVRREVIVGDVLTQGARLGEASGAPVFFALRRGDVGLGARFWLDL